MSAKDSAGEIEFGFREGRNRGAVVGCASGDRKRVAIRMSSVTNSRQAGGRQVWEDRFRKPTVEQLVAELPRSSASALQSLREQLLSVQGCIEEVTWKGVPWRWTIEIKSEQAPEKVWAYLVPQPEQPLMVLPITRDGLSGISMKKLNKPVRDAIIHAREVEGVRWAQWQIESKSQVEVLAKIAKQQMLMAASGDGVGAGVNA